LEFPGKEPSICRKNSETGYSVITTVEHNIYGNEICKNYLHFVPMDGGSFVVVGTELSHQSIHKMLPLHINPKKKS